MLPLAGARRLAMLGCEVRCGTGYADLIAVEVSTGRPVVVEVKLADNTDRRQVVTQVLGYAAHLCRLDAAAFATLLQPHLRSRDLASVTEAATATAQDPGFDATAFEAALVGCLQDGRLRCAVVLDTAPPDLVELVGYLQEVTNDRLSLDLVTVTAYDIGDRRVLVPQLVEPDRAQVSAGATGARPPTSTVIEPGADAFAAAIAQSPSDQLPALKRLLDWALALEGEQLAVLYSSIGKGRWVLNPRLPGQQRGMVSIWNDKGASLSPFRTVLQQLAPQALAALDRKAPGQIGQGNYLKADYDSELLALFRAAYVEAAGGSNDAARSFRNGASRGD